MSGRGDESCAHQKRRVNTSEQRCFPSEETLAPCPGVGASLVREHFNDCFTLPLKTLPEVQPVPHTGQDCTGRSVSLQCTCHVPASPWGKEETRRCPGLVPAGGFADTLGGLEDGG